MKMVVSLTVDNSFLTKAISLLDEYSLAEKVLESVLVTPLYTSHGTMELIQNFKTNYGSEIYFDSGGYYAQQGKIEYWDMYNKLLNYVLDPSNQWADWYILPDHPPISTDPREVVESKVNKTIFGSKLFYEKIPNNLKSKCIPTVHGRGIDHLNKCLKEYNQFDYIGFGSFSTGGTNANVNIVDPESMTYVRHINQILKEEGKRLHLFGVSSPPVIYLFDLIGAYSFDSMAWLRSAGFGKVFLPFIRAYNITHNTARNSAFTRSEFEQLKEITNHTCPFCENIKDLQDNRYYRALHNIMVMRDTVSEKSGLQKKQVISLIEEYSNHYMKLIPVIQDAIT